jgi:hypothetical protein
VFDEGLEHEYPEGDAPAAGVGLGRGQDAPRTGDLVANFTAFNDSLAALAEVPNGLYVTVALAGGVLHWASNETGRSTDEILSLLENDLDS